VWFSNFEQKKIFTNPIVAFHFPWRRHGIVVIASAYRIGDLGLESCQGLRVLELELMSYLNINASKTKTKNVKKYP
jgi:hypothetical protein